MGAMKGFSNLGALVEEHVTDQMSRRMLIGEKGMITFWKMKAGAHSAAHAHPEEQIFWILSGKTDFRVGNERRVCGPGDMGVIPGGLEHEAWFPEDTEMVNIFVPVRQDYLTSGALPYMFGEAARRVRED